MASRCGYLGLEPSPRELPGSDKRDGVQLREQYTLQDVDATLWMTVCVWMTVCGCHCCARADLCWMVAGGQPATPIAC